MAIEVFSFFSGLGFMDLGFEEAGFDIAFVNEYNHSFIQAYQYSGSLILILYLVNTSITIFILLLE